MSIDEYMDGWMAGCTGADPRIVAPERRIATMKPDWSRGVRDGAAARTAAEQAERERLERCPTCDGKRSITTTRELEAGVSESHTDHCPVCHGTGRRP